MNGSGNDSNYFSNPPTPNINIGDVNVQFPDTLLWKRRSMLLDNSGFLILAPALTASNNSKGKNSGGATRKFHLSEFRTPSVPDVEMQELPNSVVLEFLEGGVGGLQIACEDRVGQGRILEGNFSSYSLLQFSFETNEQHSITRSPPIPRPITPLLTALDELFIPISQLPAKCRFFHMPTKITPSMISIFALYS
jgi:hypothetical protein